MTALLGYIVVRDENATTICDWDGEIHNTRNGAEEELYAAREQEPLYEWYVAEVRRTEDAD